MLTQACVGDLGVELAEHPDAGLADSSSGDSSSGDSSSGDGGSAFDGGSDSVGVDTFGAPDVPGTDSMSGTDTTPAPGDEACNGLDDDADGSVDEELVMRCGSNEGACMRGRVSCEAGAFPACMPEVGPSAETCNGIDDNCDGTVDNGIAPRTCGTNVGACSTGTRSCSGGSFAACRGSVGPSAETCNGVDDNCDGTVDNGIAPRTCGTNVGTCSTGNRVCSGGSFSGCRGSVGPVPERDDGLDNDCNGVVDNGIQCENDLARRVRVATNGRRTGLRNLACDRGLRRAAQRHAADMCRTGQFSHTSADGRFLRDRLREARATYTRAGENLAYTPSTWTPEQVVTAWMGSADHRANIMDGRFGRIGVGIARCGSMTYWVQVFGN